MYINGLKSGDRVVMRMTSFLDRRDSWRALVQAFQKMDVRITDIIVVVEKGNKKKEELEAKAAR